MKREEVDAKLAATEAAVAARLAEFTTTMQAGFAEARAEMRGQFAEMRAELHKNTASLLKCGVALSLAVIGTTVGLLHFISKAS